MNFPLRYKIRMIRRFYNIRHPFHIDKWAVRMMAGRRLSDELTYRPKKGFPVSISSRLKIDPALFADGCIQEMFGLGRRAIAELPNRASKDWLFNLMLVEVWGQTLWRQGKIDDIRESLRRWVTPEAS